MEQSYGSFYKARLGRHTNIEFSILLHNFDRQAQPELWTVTKSKKSISPSTQSPELFSKTDLNGKSY